MTWVTLFCWDNMVEGAVTFPFCVPDRRHSYAFSILKQCMDAEATVQEAFVAVYETPMDLIELPACYKRLERTGMNANVSWQISQIAMRIFGQSNNIQKYLKLLSKKDLLNCYIV